MNKCNVKCIYFTVHRCPPKVYTECDVYKKRMDKIDDKVLNNCPYYKPRENKNE